MVESGLDAACDEPPLASGFLIDDATLARMYAWHTEIVEYLRAEGYELTEQIPTVDESVAKEATWSPAREFHTRCGFPGGKAWRGVLDRCGDPEGELWLGASALVFDRGALRAHNDANLALTMCLSYIGFNVPASPPFEEFVREPRWSWTSADNLGVTYGDNDRKAPDALSCMATPLEVSYPDRLRLGQDTRKDRIDRESDYPSSNQGHRRPGRARVHPTCWRWLL